MADLPGTPIAAPVAWTRTHASYRHAGETLVERWGMHDLRVGP